MTTEPLLEALECTASEIEALQAIYNEDFVVSSVSELKTATKAIECKNQDVQVSLTVRVKVEVALKLTCNLPPGYPITAAARVSVEGKTRKQEEYLTQKVQDKANSLIGQEAAILQLVHELQESVEAMESTAAEMQQELIKTNSAPLLGRRWIWAHHITNNGRRKAIIQEARELKLGGYLKSGYPGIVVVEGDSCDEFVNWIKGSKSRPGGFGRNWGHHVRGEIDITDCQLPQEFTELEDMRDLGAVCKECGLEDEFLEYVMQHKGSGV